MTERPMTTEPSAASDQVVDRFAAEVRRQLAEAIEDGAEGEELRFTVVNGVETLLTCHFCGTPGLPPCCEDAETPEESAAIVDLNLRALGSEGLRTPPGQDGGS